MKFIPTILMTFLLLGSIRAGAARSNEPPLATIVFYVG